MANQSRRDFLKTAGLIGLTVAGANNVTKAQSKSELEERRMGVLVDTTACIGCRSCEWACKEAHNLPNKPLDWYHENREILKTKRRPDVTSLTVVNEYEKKAEYELPIDVKVQCMHCEDPACVASCIVHAFTKHENGPVTWDGARCIGCRYCMVACPFQIPTFEYGKAIQPDIMKCDFCFDRTRKGLLPACVEVCPVEALTYGKREEVLLLAKSKIKEFPERYVNHVYGEYEVGGTSWVYLAGVGFNKLDFPKLGDEPAPGVSREIQHGLFRYFVPPVALYVLLGGIMWISKKKINEEEEE